LITQMDPNNDKPNLKLNPACEILGRPELDKSRNLWYTFLHGQTRRRVSSAGEKEAMRVGQVAEGLRQEELSYLNRS
jgi:hypothetical protein